MSVNEGYYGGYYDEYGNWIEEQVSNIPAGHVHDGEGRLLRTNLVNDTDYPEVIDTFTQDWQQQRILCGPDGAFASQCVWPHIDRIVNLVRFDIFHNANPRSQQGTSSIADSRRIRKAKGWMPLRTMYFLDMPTDITMDLNVESTGPPRRDKFILATKKNPKDLSLWNFKEKINAYVGADRIPGCAEFCIDFCDTPDRYFISDKPTPELGYRRLYRFGSYPVTQYYILERLLHHDSLDAEDGEGYTYMIESGPVCFARKNWRIIGSFYGFDHPITGSNLYTVHYRYDPFPRMLLSMGAIDHAEEWPGSMSFYAHDVPLPGSTCYSLHHCIRSIYSTAAHVTRHRLTKDDARMPWEFRMNIYVYPANLEDVTYTRTPKVSYADNTVANYG